MVHREYNISDSWGAGIVVGAVVRLLVVARVEFVAGIDSELTILST